MSLVRMIEFQVTGEVKLVPGSSRDPYFCTDVGRAEVNFLGSLRADSLQGYKKLPKRVERTITSFTFEESD